jgi:hypothetical protein
MSDQTKLSDDAAVNAESAAKLVSDAKRKMIDGIMAQREEILRAFVAKYGAEPDEIVQVCQGERWWIERHATQHTQATHGEGEAVAPINQEETRDIPSAYICVEKATGKQIGVEWFKKEVSNTWYWIPLYEHPPSLVDEIAYMDRVLANEGTTAAPALEPATDHICEYDGIASCRICSGKYAFGELGARLNGLADRFISSSSEKVSMDLTDEAMLRQAAAALSGVAAQGDCEARVIIRDLVDAIDRDAFDYHWSREDPEPILDRARAFLK